MTHLISREAAKQVAMNRESHAKGETARACRGIAVAIDMLPAHVLPAGISHCLKVDHSAIVARILQGGIELRRDDDLIRKMMMDMEEDEDWVHDFGLHSDSDDDDYSAHYHAMLLADEGLLAPYGNKGLYRLTNQGHDWVAAVREDTVWAKTKAATGHVAGVSLKMIGSIAEGYVRQKLSALGIPT